MVFFYANDGLIALARPARILAALAVLIGLFDRVGLQTNMQCRLSYFWMTLRGGI